MVLLLPREATAQAVHRLREDMVLRRGAAMVRPLQGAMERLQRRAAMGLRLRQRGDTASKAVES